MTLREFYLKRRKSERAAFVKVLNALPKEKGDYRPDPRSRSALDLAWLLVAEEKGFAELIGTGRIDFADTGHAPGASTPQSLDGLAEAYERRASEVDALVWALDEETWGRKAQFLVNGQVLMEPPLGELLWHLYFDTLHHRSQLSVYIRPMGGKVPAIYGPSADDAGT